MAFTKPSLVLTALCLFASLVHSTPVAEAAPDAQSSPVLNAMSYKGCFSSSSGLSDQGSYTYQSQGYCQPICVNSGQAVLGLSGGSDCWCGNELPPADSQVEDSKCSTPCDGYPDDMCGGNGFYTVYLTGITDSVDSSNGDSDSSSTSASGSTPSKGSSSTSGPATVITSMTPGKTVVITEAATPSSSKEASGNGGSGGPNTAAIAAGVIVAVVVVCALIGGFFVWRRYQHRKEAEEQYKKNQVAEFMAGSREPKLPSTGWSTSDSRLDPEAGRRNSFGSIADDQDYSRRILRVANPS